LILKLNSRIDNLEWKLREMEDLVNETKSKVVNTETCVNDKLNEYTQSKRINTIMNTESSVSGNKVKDLVPLNLNLDRIAKKLFIIPSSNGNKIKKSTTSYNKKINKNLFINCNFNTLKDKNSTISTNKNTITSTANRDLNLDLFKPFIPSTKSTKNSLFELYTNKSLYTGNNSRSKTGKNSAKNSIDYTCNNAHTKMLINSTINSQKNSPRQGYNRRDFLLNEINNNYNPAVKKTKSQNLEPFTLNNSHLMEQLNLIKLKTKGILLKLADNNKKLVERVKHTHSKSNCY
jgi:hypothetical protein